MAKYILIVEPDGEMVDLLEDEIQSHERVEVAACSTPAEALLLIDTAPYDLLIVTDNLGRGSKLIRDIRRQSKTIPIIGMSANRDRGPILLEAGANTFFCKADWESFAPLVHNFLNI